jgi:hypothetical protein
MNDVKLHSDNITGSGAVPAVKVKVYNWPTTEQVHEHLSKSVSVTIEQSQIAYEAYCAMASMIFWQIAAQAIAEDIFGNVSIRSQGRSDGWLVVDEITAFAEWDDVDYEKWSRFENAIHSWIKLHTSLDCIVAHCSDMQYK